MVICVLHEGVQDFERGRVCYGLLLSVRESSTRGVVCWLGPSTRCREGPVDGSCRCEKLGL